MVDKNSEGSPLKAPFWLTPQQGCAARQLLSYLSALPLATADAQLLGVVVAIRAARGGRGNVTGVDLRALKLDDADRAIGELRRMGWTVPDQLLDGDPEVPVGVTVPALAVEADHPLPFGKATLSRVSGWTARTLSAKPVKKTSATARLAALFLAAHSSSTLSGTIPSDFPEACRTALPDLLAKGFLSEWSGDRYRLAHAVRHLAGRLPRSSDPAMPAPRRGSPHFTPPPLNEAAWERWKADASPALLRHVEAVETCSLCSLPRSLVAAAFTTAPTSVPPPRYRSGAYSTWKDANPDRGPEAARFTVAFRSEHGHGPSYRQLTAGLRWKLPRDMGAFAVRRLLVNEWLTDTAPVPWTLRPGRAAEISGIALLRKDHQPAR
jgi:hypothetical protein